MKIRNEIKTVKETSCCETTTSVAQKNNTDLCCEQPTDGTSCCDKSSPKEVNAAKTGCC